MDSGKLTHGDVLPIIVSCFLWISVFCLFMAQPCKGAQLPEGEEKVRVICFLSSLEGMEEINDQITKGMQAEAKEHPEISLSIYGVSDFGKVDFTQLVRIFLAMKGDYMISFAMPGMEDAVPLIEKEHVRLILFDSDMKEKEARLSFIGTDNPELVDQIMDSVADNRVKPHVAVFVMPVHSTTMTRLRKIESEIKERKNFTLSNITYLPKWDVMTASEEMRQVLSSDPGINAIICIDTYSTEIAARALGDLPRSYYAVGFDTSEVSVKALKDGVLDCLAVQDFQKMGKISIQTVQKDMAGEKVFDHAVNGLVLSSQSAEKIP